MRRLVAGLVGAAGLAYPACAAVCPRGIGGCPFPGRCFLFTDVDANAACDYTRTSVTGGTSFDPTATASPASTSTAPAVTATTAAPVLPSPSGAGATGLVSVSGLLAGLILFLITAGAVFALLRSGRAGPRASEAGPALALSSFFALGAGEIATYLLSGQAASASVFATVYLLAGSVLAAYAWCRGAVTRPVAVALAGMSTVFGFAVLAPLMPVKFVGLVTIAASGGSVLTPGVVGILGGIALAFAVGLLFSLPAHVSRYRLRRTASCVNCRKCERTCPARVAGRDDSKRECYLCGRCTAACPVHGALAYTAGRT